MPNRIDYVDDWAERLRSRLYTQFRSATTWQQWCDDVLGPQFQDLEDAAQTLLTLLDIDASEGVQLDNIGRIVGQPRNGVDDDTYRLYLSARILANKSDGTVEDIYNVMRALFGQDETQPTYHGGLVKQFAIRIGAILTAAEAAIATRFLRDSKEAGARGILEWQESADAAMFYTGSDPLLTSAITGGGATISVSVTSTDGFPSTGTITIDPGTPIEESALYEAIAGNSFDVTGVTWMFTNNHAAGAVVRLSTGQMGDGLGTGDTADAAVGGCLAGAEEA